MNSDDELCISCSAASGRCWGEVHHLGFEIQTWKADDHRKFGLGLLHLHVQTPHINESPDLYTVETAPTYSYCQLLSLSSRISFVDGQLSSQWIQRPLAPVCMLLHTEDCPWNSILHILPSRRRARNIQYRYRSHCGIV